MALGLSLALLIGLSLGLFGGGGSLLSLPLLIYGFGIPTKVAVAASLWTIGFTGLTAVVSHVRAGLVDFRTGAWFGAASMLGAFAGGRLAVLVPEALLLSAFGVVMLATALTMLRGHSSAAKGPVAGRGPVRKLLVYGLLVGTLTGLVGAGGGFLVVPTLVLLGGMDMKRAVATSLLVVTLQSFAGFAGHLGHVDVPWVIVLPVTLVACLGSVAGGMLLSKANTMLLRRGFAWMVMAVAGFVLAHELPAVVTL